MPTAVSVQSLAFPAGTSANRERGPPVADGILSVAPDTPDVVERRKRGIGLDCVESTSKYLEDGDTGEAPTSHASPSSGPST
jgi:hypothetical protein